MTRFLPSRQLRGGGGDLRAKEKSAPVLNYVPGRTEGSRRCAPEEPQETLPLVSSYEKISAAFCSNMGYAVGALTEDLL